MSESSGTGDRLHTLLRDYPSAPPPAGFGQRVMDALPAGPPALPVWRRPGLRWSLAALGLSLGLARIASFALSVWLVVETAG